MLNALTVDVEDYYQVSAFDPYVERSRWDNYPCRVVRNTEQVLALCERHQVRGTFFVLGWVAEHYPELVRRIASQGHEIGCHSYWHRLIYQLTPEVFREDLRKAKAVLESAAGLPVTAFRAASFSITGQSIWALDILQEEGFTVDSSIYPIYHDRYGLPNAERFPHKLRTAHGELWEFPLSFVRVWGTRLPVGGGGYFRLYPFWWTASCIRRINRLGQPAICYVHPWELDPEQPRIPGLSFGRRFRHYVHLASTERKLDRLLSTFRFGALGDLVSDTGSEESAIEDRGLRIALF